MLGKCSTPKLYPAPQNSAFKCIRMKEQSVTWKFRKFFNENIIIKCKLVVYMCLCICMSVCVYVHACISQCVYMCDYVCIPVCFCVSVRMYLCMCMPVCLSVCMFTCMHVCMHKHWHHRFLNMLQWVHKEAQRTVWSNSFNNFYAFSLAFMNTQR